VVTQPLFRKIDNHMLRVADLEAAIAFTCETRPEVPCAITGPDGNDTTDRWREALMMKEKVEQLWAKTTHSR